MSSDTDAVHAHQGQGKQAKRALTTDEHTPLRVLSRGVHFVPLFFVDMVKLNNWTQINK